MTHTDADRRGPDGASPDRGGSRPRLGVALGGGSARGWAHVGVLEVLTERGLTPDVVAGTSVGAVVGAAWAAGELDRLVEWALDAGWQDLLRLFDLSFSGGLLRGDKVFDVLAEQLPDRLIEDLPCAFGAVATDMNTGEEVWLRDGSLFTALRASAALPGAITPLRHEGRWLVDGGLVDPVPVALCRALGAERVLAVDLGSSLVSAAMPEPGSEPPVDIAANAGRRVAPNAGSSAAGPGTDEPESSGWARLAEGTRRLRRKLLGRDADAPSLYAVLANSINIMQVRITRIRLAGDPPDVLVVPRMPGFSLFDFHRARDAIAEGRRAAEAALEEGHPLLVAH